MRSESLCKRNYKLAETTEHGSSLGRNRFGTKIGKLNKQVCVSNYWLWLLVIDSLQKRLNKDFVKMLHPDQGHGQGHDHDQGRPRPPLIMIMTLIMTLIMIVTLIMTLIMIHILYFRRSYYYIILLYYYNIILLYYYIIALSYHHIILS